MPNDLMRRSVIPSLSIWTDRQSRLHLRKLHLQQFGQLGESRLVVANSQCDMVGGTFGSPAVHPGGYVEIIAGTRSEAQARVGIADS